MLYQQRFESDCPLITSINAALYLGTIIDYDINSEEYLGWYRRTCSGGKCQQFETDLGLHSFKVKTTFNNLRQHLRQGLPVEMNTYSLRTGWHSVLLASLDLKEDPIVEVCGSYLEDFHFKSTTPLSKLFDFSLYPFQCLHKGVDYSRVFQVLL